MQVGMRTGALALKEARQRLHVSQGKLAESSGVSERTIRGLESGEVLHPHPSTLLALATALKLPADEIDQFFRIWQGWGELPSYHEVLAVDSDQGPLEAVQAGLVRSFYDKRVVAASRVVQVGAHRQILRETYLTTVEALVDGVDSHLIVASLSRPHQDPDQLEITDTTGCVVRSSAYDAETRTIQIELALGRTLRAGELATVGWTEVNGWAHPALANDVVDVRYVNRFLRPVSSLVMQVCFEQVTPVRIGVVDGAPPPMGPRSGGPLVPDEFGSVSVHWQNSAAGRFGLVWDWTEPQID